MPMTAEQIVEFKQKHGEMVLKDDLLGPQQTRLETLQVSLDVAHDRIEILERRVKNLVDMHAKLANKLTIIQNQLLFP